MVKQAICPFIPDPCRLIHDPCRPIHDLCRPIHDPCRLSRAGLLNLPCLLPQAPRPAIMCYTIFILEHQLLLQSQSYVTSQTLLSRIFCHLHSSLHLCISVRPYFVSCLRASCAGDPLHSGQWLAYAVTQYPCLLAPFTTNSIFPPSRRASTLQLSSNTCPPPVFHLFPVALYRYLVIQDHRTLGYAQASLIELLVHKISKKNKPVARG